jgi:nitroreductase
MKRLLAALLLVATTSWISAQDVQLPAPRKSGGLPLMEALANRTSARAYDARELSSQQLADLLWAGFGVNRPDGKRTAPSANNKQEIEIYVLLPQGAFVYDAPKNQLREILGADVRPSVGRVDAPVILVYVADLAKRGDSGDGRRNVAATDSGFIGQNVYLFCASEGLATVYRGGFNAAELTPKLKLRPDQTILAVQPVGYPKK